MVILVTTSRTASLTALAMALQNCTSKTIEAQSPYSLNLYDMQKRANLERADRHLRKRIFLAKQRMVCNTAKRKIATRPKYKYR